MNTNVMQVDSGALFALDDTAFLKQAYLRLLGRVPDAEGLRGYLEAMHQGQDRATIYQALASSDEAQRYEARRQALRRPPAVRPSVPSLAAPGSAFFAPVVVETLAPVPEAKDMDALLALEGAVFVRAAYLALLGRDADDAGLQNYLGFLRDGWSKMHTLKGLSNSDEARAANRRLPGLQQALARYHKAQRRSWSGWYHRSVLGIESDMPIERQLRAAHAALRRG
jgi:hypothetical protein